MSGQHGQSPSKILAVMVRNFIRKFRHFFGPHHIWTAPYVGRNFENLKGHVEWHPPFPPCIILKSDLGIIYNNVQIFRYSETNWNVRFSLTPRLNPWNLHIDIMFCPRKSHWSLALQIDIKIIINCLDLRSDIEKV